MKKEGKQEVARNAGEESLGKEAEQGKGRPPELSGWAALVSLSVVLGLGARVGWEVKTWQWRRQAIPSGGTVRRSVEK